uniref:ELM2 domain-containing protein n=1 Tax=Panagrolaimus sp. ES5 TaxID=591445 RepID=A0AC34GS35_9BILA
MSSLKKRGRPKKNAEKQQQHQPPLKKIKIDEKAVITILKPVNIIKESKSTVKKDARKKAPQISTRSGRKIKKPCFLSSMENDFGDGSGDEKDNNGEKQLEHDSTTTTAETGPSDIESENGKNYYDSAAALLPEFMDSVTIDDDGKDFDELVFDGKEVEFSNEIVSKYILACQAKTPKCDVHFALMHFAANNYSLIKALEKFDQKFQGSVEVWTTDELNTFMRIMNNSKSYKDMHKISKNIPNKSTANIVNAYYALKKNICSFGRVFTICPQIIETHKPALGYFYVESIKCENCVKHLWKNPPSNYTTNMLCSMCKLYDIFYGRLRPNALSTTSQIFDTSRMAHDKCLFKPSTDDFGDEKFIPDWNVLKMNVYKIKSTQMKALIDSVKYLNPDQKTKDMISATENMNENYTYIFFSKNPLSNLLLQFYPQNGISLFECLNFIDPPIANIPKKRVSLKLCADSDDDEYGSPPILVDEREWNVNDVPEKVIDVFYFGYFDETNEFHNGHGLEFHHAYMEKLQNFTDSPYFSSVKTVNDKSFECDSVKDLADKELIERYGNISFSTFSQNFIDSRKKFKATAESLNVPIEYLEAYVRQNYYNLKKYFAQFDRMIKPRTRRAKGRNRATAASATTTIDEREKRPNYFSFKETPKKRNNHFLAL